jgi:hypothetical protein
MTMSKAGRKVVFHGAFGSKKAAKAKEHEVGGFVRPITVRGSRRWVVMTGKRKRK